MNGEKSAGLAADLKNLFKLSSVHCDGLFAYYVLACAHCGDAVFCVEIIWYGNGDHVDAGNSQQLFQSFAGDQAVLFRKVQTLLSDIECGNDFKSVHRFIDAFVVPGGHSAVAYKTKLMCHCFFLLEKKLFPAEEVILL